MGKEVGLAVGLGALVGIIALAKKKPTQDNTKLESPDGSLVLEVFDQNGKPIPYHSPYSFTEGASYTVRVSVTNKSWKVSPDYLVPANLTVSVIAGINSATWLNDSIPYSFGAGETKAFSWTFAIPVGTAGAAGGVIGADVKAPNGVQLKNVGNTFTIGAAEIVYSADIVFA